MIYLGNRIYTKMLSRSYFTKNAHRSCKCYAQSKRVFERSYRTKETDLNMVRDAYCACHTLSKKQKEACYLVYDLDGDSVEKYYPLVEKLETSFKETHYWALPISRGLRLISGSIVAMFQGETGI